MQNTSFVDPIDTRVIGGKPSVRVTPLAAYELSSEIKNYTSWRVPAKKKNIIIAIEFREKITATVGFPPFKNVTVCNNKTTLSL